MTIKEIAELIGVSPTTVSNVIHGHGKKMSEETRKKIEEALVKYHYVHTGQGKPKEDSEMKLVLVAFFLREKQHVLTDPFCGMLLESIQRKLASYQFHTVCEIPQNEEELIVSIKSRNVSGAIILGYDDDKCESLANRIPKPIVFVDSGEGNYDNIGLEDFKGAYEITSYLIRQCHKKIVFFADYLGDTCHSNKERLRGFKCAMEENNLPYDDAETIYLPEDRYLRKEILRKFARRKAGSIYTAGLFFSDFLANEAISVFFSQGIRVPDEFSVAGFDDNVYARLSRPALTTVRQYPDEKGAEAVKLLMKRILGQPVRTGFLQLPTELIVRESVRNIGK